MRKTGVYIFLFIFSLVAANAQPHTIGKIDTTDLRRHLTFLSSNELSGRWVDASSCGICKAAGYLKTNAEQVKLSPGFPGFSQKVVLVSSAPDTSNSFIEIRNKKKKLTDKTTGVPSVFAGAAFKIKNAQLIFAGFGITGKTAGYDDFSGVGLKGKIVVISTGTPESFKNKESMRWNNQLEMTKASNAIKAGAAAVLLVVGAADGTAEMYNRLKNYMNRENWSVAEKQQPNSTRFAIVNVDWADKVLGEKNSYRNLLTNIAESKKSNSFLVENVRVTIDLKKNTKETVSENIVALVEGSDPDLKNECVVFMAHYDHLGVDKTGDVFNGADDNGSGAVALLEIAEAFAALDQKPKRSIVFLWVTAEEVGMLGSKFYTENPLFPMVKTKACINLDMVGRVFEPRDTVWNRSPKKVKDFDGIFAVTNNVWPGLKEKTITACNKTGLVPDFSLPPYFMGSSDHASFDKKGVPVLNLSTGYHADYHKPTDEIEKINFAKMKRVADLCFILGFDIANSEIHQNKETN